MIWYDMIWYDMIWYDMICDMIWYDMKYPFKDLFTSKTLFEYYWTEYIHDALAVFLSKNG